MAGGGRRSSHKTGLLDWSGDGLGVWIGHFVIVRSFNVGGCFFVFFDVGGALALAALLRGGEEEAGFYG